MAFRKSLNGPQISEVSPAAAIPGGEFQIRGKGLAGTDRPHVKFGELSAPIVIGSDSFVIARVPDGAPAGEMTVGNVPYKCEVGLLVADSLHPVSNPVIDRHGSIASAMPATAAHNAAIPANTPSRLANGFCHLSSEPDGAGIAAGMARGSVNS